jgi:hypothetical protein
LNETAIFEALKVTAGNTKLDNSNIKDDTDIKQLKESIINSKEFFNDEIKKRLNVELNIRIDIT